MNLVEVLNIKPTREDDKWIYEYNKNTLEFIGIQEQIELLKNWMSSNTMKTGLILHGPIGCGKTSACLMSCNEKNIHYYIRDSVKKRSKKDLTLYYEQICNFNKCILIMDDMDILANGEFIPVSDLYKWIKLNNSSRTKIKIIFIISSVYLKKLKDFSKICDYIEFKYPTYTQFSKKCSKYKFSKTDMKEITTFYKNEPRSILNKLNNNLNLSSLQSTNIDYDMYDSYNLMFSDLLLIEKIRIFYKENGTIPIIFQENYYDWKLSNKSYYVLSKFLSDADMFHKQMFSSNLYLNIDIYAIMSTLLPIEYIKSKYNIIKQKPKTKPRFGLLWTKQSAMYQKKKFIQNIENNITDSPTVDMNKLYEFRQDIEKVMQNKNQTDVLNLLEDNNWTVSQAYSLFNLFNFTDDDVDKKKQFKSLMKI